MTRALLPGPTSTERQRARALMGHRHRRARAAMAWTCCVCGAGIGRECVLGDGPWWSVDPDAETHILRMDTADAHDPEGFMASFKVKPGPNVLLVAASGV